MIPALSQTSVFKYAESLGSSKITKVIADTIDLNKGAIYVTESALEDVFYKMRYKTFPFKAKFAVIDLFRTGVIKLVYNPKTKLTVAIPFFTYKMDNNNFGVIVNITNYASIDKDGQVKIDPVVLYTLMLSAAFSLKIQDNTSILATNGFVDLYSDMLIAVLIKMINVDVSRKERIKFLFSKFMYMRFYDEKRASDAARVGLNNIDNYSLDQIDLTIPNSAYETFESLIVEMRSSLAEVGTVSFGLLFDRFMKTFGEPAAFAIEYPPFMVFIFCALIANCNGIVNVKAIESSAVKGGKSPKLQVLFDRIENVVMNMNT